MKALPTQPPSFSVEQSGEIVVEEESVPYITTPPIPKTPVEFISVELKILASQMNARFELSLNAPTSLRLPRGPKPVRGLEKWRGELDITIKTVQKVRDDDDDDELRLVGIQGRVRSDEPCALAKVGDLLTVWVVPDGDVGGLSVQSARILYGQV